MKKLRFLAAIIAGLWCCLTVNAYEYTKVYDFYKNNIYYEITSASTVKVTYNYYNDNDESDYYGEYYTSYGNNIPSTVEYNGITYTVTAIGDYAFYTSDITSITIPNTVVSIGERAFTYCRSLTSITIPESVTNIGWQAFYGCEKLQSLTISAQTAPKIGYQTFQNIPKSCVLDYPIEGFDSYSSWQSYFTFNKFRVDGIYYKVINGDVEVIDDNEGYVSNADLYVGDIVIPESVSFSGKKYTVSYISMTAFWNSTKMTSITIPSTIKSIPPEAFRGCTGLTSVVISEGVEEIGGSAFSGTALNSVTIPSSVKIIDSEAFSACSNLEEIILSNGVTSIYFGAFSNCRKLTSITIPESVTSIGDDAFWYCRSLTDVYCYAKEVPTTETNTFDNSYIGNATLHVLASALEAYKTTAPWSSFGKFEILTPTPVTITINQYGSGTYCSKYALDFSEVEGLKAYAATGYNTKTGIVTLIRVMTSKPGMGLFIKGEPGEYTVPVLEGTDDNSLNMLVGTLEQVKVNKLSDDGRYVNFKYTLYNDELKFWSFDGGFSLGAGKAYLQIPVEWIPAMEARSIGIRFDEGGTTDIKDTEFTIQHSELIYDLMGRRVASPQKGNLYIINGKKVIY